MSKEDINPLTFSEKEYRSFSPPQAALKEAWSGGEESAGPNFWEKSCANAVGEMVGLLRLLTERPSAWNTATIMNECDLNRMGSVIECKNGGYLDRRTKVYSDSGSTVLFDYLYIFLADRRRKINESSENPRASTSEEDMGQMGVFRLVGEFGAAITEVSASDRYRDQYTALKRRWDCGLKAGRDSGNIPASVRDRDAQLNFSVDNGLFTAICWQPSFETEEHTDPEALTIKHPYPKEDGAAFGVMKKLDTQLQALLKFGWPAVESEEYGARKQEFFKELGSFSWTLAHIMPLCRGSAAVSDMFIKSIMKFHGFELEPYKAQVPWKVLGDEPVTVSWDLKAMFEMQEAYAEEFMAMFEQEPQRQVEIQRGKTLEEQAKAATSGLGAGQVKAGSSGTSARPPVSGGRDDSFNGRNGAL